MLRPTERALYIAVETCSRDKAERQSGRPNSGRLEQLRRELENLTKMAASGGAVPAILDALVKKDEERRKVEREIADRRKQTIVDVSPRTLRTQMRELLADWSAFID